MILGIILILIGILLFAYDVLHKKEKININELLIIVITIVKTIIMLWIKILSILAIGSFLSSLKDKYWNNK